jgi:type IV secretory pathway VirJ component
MSAQMLKMIADMKAQLAAMEAALSGSAAAVPTAAAVSAAVKPKRELSAGMKAWHERNMRIDALLKDAGLPFKRVAEAKQFASMIWKNEKKFEKDYGIKKELPVEAILDERRRWARDHAPRCPVCEEDATEEPAQHSACATTFIQTFMGEGKGDKDAGMAAWLKACGIKAAKSDSEEEAAPVAKKAGRPKMTEEQKAAAAAAKAAMTPEEKAAAVAKRAAAKAAREAKKPTTPAKPAEAPKKVAWAAPAGGAAEPSVEEQIDALIESM